MQVADFLAAILDVTVHVDHHNVILSGSTGTTHRQLVGLSVGDVINLGLGVIIRQGSGDGRRNDGTYLRCCRVVGQGQINGRSDSRVGLRLGVVVRQVDGGLTDEFPIVGGRTAFVGGECDVLVLHVLLLTRLTRNEVDGAHRLGTCRRQGLHHLILELLDGSDDSIHLCG